MFFISRFSKGKIATSIILNPDRYHGLKTAISKHFHTIHTLLTQITLKNKLNYIYILYMDIVLYDTEEEMPKKMRPNKSATWNILDKMEWDDWNYVPTDHPQKSMFNSHVTWNSHRQDYIIKSDAKRAIEKLAERRMANDNKFGSADDYAQELKDAEAEEARYAEEEAMEVLKEKLTYSNTVIVEAAKPIYTGFKKMSEEEAKARLSVRNAARYKKNKDKLQKEFDESKMTTCGLCGGEHKDHPRGWGGHKQTVQHQVVVYYNKAAKARMSYGEKTITLEEAEQRINSIVKNTESKLNRKLSQIALRNKYKNLLAQYSS